MVHPPRVTERCCTDSWNNKKVQLSFQCLPSVAHAHTIRLQTSSLSLQKHPQHWSDSLSRLFMADSWLFHYSKLLSSCWPQGKCSHCQKCLYIHHIVENTEQASDGQVDATGSDYPPFWGAPIWLKQLVWQHCFCSILVLVWLPMVHWRKQGLQAMCSDTNAAKEEKQKKKEVIFSIKLWLIMMWHHNMSAP